MDLPDYRRRGDNEPPPDDPVDGELSGDDYDHNLDETERVFTEIDGEFVKKSDAAVVEDSLTELEFTDTIYVRRGDTFYLATLASLAALVGTPPSEVAPSAFEAGDWTATAGVEEIELDITALPDDGGSAITALQYRLDGGSWTNLSGTGTGVRTITGLTGAVEYDVQIRAVNAIGSGAASDTKSRTPSASGGGGGDAEYISESLTSASFTVNATRPAGAGAGHYLTAFAWGSNTSIESLTAPAGWTGGVGVNDENSGCRMFTAAGDVSVMTFEGTGLQNVFIIATTAPLRSGDGQSFVRAYYGGGGGGDADVPTPSITATAGDLVASVHILIGNEGATLAGTAPSGFTSEYLKNDASPMISVLSRADAPSGATGTISHSANAAYFTRWLFTGSYGD